QNPYITERSIYTAFGERNELERATPPGQPASPFTNQWAPRGFGPPGVGGPRPNGLSDPRSVLGGQSNPDGQTPIGTPADPNGELSYGFQGRRHDDIPGVMNFRNRLYDPHLGRFLEMDPANDPNSPNPYCFEANNPVNNLDPTGNVIIAKSLALAQEWVADLQWAGYNATYWAVKSKTGPVYKVVTWNIRKHRGPKWQITDEAPHDYCRNEPIWLMAEDAETTAGTYDVKDDLIYGRGPELETGVTLGNFGNGALVGVYVGGVNLGRAGLDTAIAIGTLGYQEKYFGPLKGYAGSEASYGFDRFATELGVGFATGGAGQGLEATSWTVRTVQWVGLAQTVRSAHFAYQGGKDWLKNGPSVSAGIKLIGGSLGAGSGSYALLNGTFPGATSAATSVPPQRSSVWQFFGRKEPTLAPEPTLTPSPVTAPPPGEISVDLGEGMTTPPAKTAGVEDPLPTARSIVPYYPPNRGFLADPTAETLPPGTRIDRFGFEGGTFTSPEGTPMPMRALPPGAADKPYNIYVLLKPVEVKAGLTAPWFYQPGFGIQYEMPMSIKQLLQQEYLKRVGE
ncbi:MAG: glycohydrolase toxin TNT-related protein, partial [Terriglobia bacterium]